MRSVLECVFVESTFMNDVVQTHGGSALEGVSSPVGFFMLPLAVLLRPRKGFFFFGFHPTEVCNWRCCI